MDVDWEIDVKKVQKRWETYDDWSQLVLKQTEDQVELITSAPRAGCGAWTATARSSSSVR